MAISNCNKFKPGTHLQPIIQEVETGGLNQTSLGYRDQPGLQNNNNVTQRSRPELNQDGDQKDHLRSLTIKGFIILM